MPVPIDEALGSHASAAAAKASSVRDVPRYLMSSALAGAYVGMAIVLLISVSAPLVAAGSASAKLVQAGVFGLALTLVVFAGAELFTGNAMVMLQGWWRRTTTPIQVLAVLVASLAGNVAGAIAFAAAVHAGGTITGPSEQLVAAMVTAKDALAGPQLFWRAVLCNALVCLALWMAARTASDTAKLAVVWWALLAFIGSGFEHSIANVTTFALAAFDGTIGWSALARNLAWTVPGNVVGGGLVVGLGYAWMGHKRPARARVSVAAGVASTAVTTAATTAVMSSGNGTGVTTANA
jgi:nitrite transporter NirC